MSARPPQYRVVALAALLVAATVPPSVGVASAGPSASFSPNVVYEQSGDVANITVHASKRATVNIGSPAESFWLQVDVGEGTTKLRVNTYKAGESSRYSLSEMVWAAEGSVKGRRLRTQSIDAPLDPAKYPMNVTVGGQERAIGALVVKKRETRGISARIAPRAAKVSKFRTAADVRKASVEPWKSSIARDDWLFVHVDATGVRGALSKARLDGDGGVMRVDFEQTNPPMNGRGNEFTGASVRRVLVPPDDEGFYLAVDTGDHDIEPGDRYEIRFTIPKASPLANAAESVATEIRVVERRVHLDGEDGDRGLVVEGKTTISGSTTLTPGTTINITARDADLPPIYQSRTVTVPGDRTFSTTFDFSDLKPGREFEIRLADQRRSVPAVVAGATTTAAPTTTTTTTTKPTTTAKSTPTSTAKTTTTKSPSKPTSTTPKPTTTGTTRDATADGLTQVAIGDAGGTITQQPVNASGAATKDGGTPVPGFGPGAALLAVAAGALLAARRP